MVSNTELLSRIRNGNMSAQVAFYREYHAPAYASAMRIVRDEQLAEDICHDTMIKAFEHIKAGKKIENPKSWMRVVARNEAISKLRKSSKYENQFMEVEKQDVLEEQESDWQNISLEDILQAIEQLPAGYRLIVTLYLLEDLDHAQIAEALDISPGTSRSQYLRAKRKLQTLLKEYHGG